MLLCLRWLTTAWLEGGEYDLAWTAGESVGSRARLCRARLSRVPLPSPRGEAVLVPRSRMRGCRQTPALGEGHAGARRQGRDHCPCADQRMVAEVAAGQRR